MRPFDTGGCQNIGPRQQVAKLKERQRCVIAPALLKADAALWTRAPEVKVSSSRSTRSSSSWRTGR